MQKFMAWLAGVMLGGILACGVPVLLIANPGWHHALVARGWYIIPLFQSAELLFVGSILLCHSAFYHAQSEGNRDGKEDIKLAVAYSPPWFILVKLAWILHYL